MERFLVSTLHLISVTELFKEYAIGGKFVTHWSGEKSVQIVWWIKKTEATMRKFAEEKVLTKLWCKGRD